MQNFIMQIKIISQKHKFQRISKPEKLRKIMFFKQKKQSPIKRRQFNYEPILQTGNQSQNDVD